MTRHGEINWTELITADPQQAMDFYGATLGWTFEGETMPDGHTYWIILSDGRPVGGVMHLEASYAPADGDRWMTYIHVDDLDAAVDAARRKGATIMRPPWAVPGVGTVCILRQPGGAMVGWVTPVERPMPA
ncbi:MAG: VOC family protein [Roseitalea sp.]|jgi:predicted enzyme related to lactoylglutathione lyase|nr:VOC family protein [Roseitalea sp.]MBO6722034.1 VOC family protein [Roseitalea sp.]MBO6743472.1 VOC family protein [Roseitalea sp.]